MNVLLILATTLSLHLAGTALAQNQTSNDILVVAAGGWKSCHLGILNQFIARSNRTLLADLRANFPQKNVYALTICAAGIKAAFGNSQVQYTSPLLAAHTYSWTAVNRIAARIQEIRRAIPGIQVYGIGHSHGGYFIGAAANASRFDGIFLLEPISAQQCRTLDWLRNRTRKIFKRRQRMVPGCRMAPTDLNTSVIAANTGGNFYNYILDDNTYKGDVHSSAMANAHNIQYPHAGAKNDHHMLGLNGYVWQDICRRMTRLIDPENQAENCRNVEVDKTGRFIRYR